MTPQEEQRWYAVYQAMNGTKSPQAFVGIIRHIVAHHIHRYGLYYRYEYIGTDEKPRIDLLCEVINLIGREEAKGSI